MKKTYLPVTFLVIAGIVSPAFTNNTQAASYIYDDLNRLIRVIESGEHVTDFYYDEVGNRIETTSQNLSYFALATFSATSSPDTNYVVTFDASSSSCSEEIADPDSRNIITETKPCDYTWDFGGSGSVIGGNGTDSPIYQYDSAGTYDVTLTVSVQENPSVSDSMITPITALQVEAIPNDFTTTVTGYEVTLSAVLLPDVVSVDIDWNDKAISTYSGSPENFQAVHTYLKARTFKITVTTYDSLNNETTYDYRDDGDLSVPVPQ